MVSITPSPDFSKLQVRVMKLLLDNACVFHWCSQGQCAQNRTHGVPAFPVPSSAPQLSGHHPVSIPHPCHRQNPMTLPRSFFPFKPTFSLDHLVSNAIFTSLSGLATTCSPDLFHSLCPLSACFFSYSHPSPPTFLHAILVSNTSNCFQY